MGIIDEILLNIIVVFGFLASYRVVYTIIGVILPSRKFKATDKQCTYAFLIGCRDEEKVIAQLIDSIKKQDYPQDKLTIFVCADRCTDNTAQVARDAGAIVYERNNPPKNKMRRSKGFAIDFLLENIKKDYEKGIETFDGVFMLDADNLLAANYVTEYNKAFQNKNYDFFNSYLNSKNNASTFIASFASAEEIANIVFNNRPRSLLGVSDLARGRGVLYRSHLLANGWKWCNIAIDANSSATFISQGYRSSYCEAAELFDEKPLNAKILFRQRIRWSRGQFNAFCRWSGALFLGIFWPKDWRKQKPETYEKKKFSLLAEVQKRYSCYDALVRLFPLTILTFVYTLLYPLGTLVYKMIFSGNHDLMPMVTLMLAYYGVLYISNFAVYIATIIREHKRMRVNPYKMLLYAPFWPFVAILNQYVSLWALIIPVKWKPIPHVEGKTIEEMSQEKTIAEIIYNKKNKKENL